MKKLLLTITAVLVYVGAFGQGKLSFQLGICNLVYFTSDTKMMVPIDANKQAQGFPLAGSTLYTGLGSTIAALAGSPTLVASLWGGTSSSSLTLQTTTTFMDMTSDYQFNPVNCVFPNLPANQTAYFQIQIYDSRAASAAAAWSVPFLYAGESPIFTAVPQIAAYNPICQTGSPVNSTLPVGTFVPWDCIGWPGAYGSIAVYAVVPEPGTFALFGLGAAALLVFHWRK